jgi:hypothetical protein
MPTEMRRIVFSGEELRAALDGHRVRPERPLPPGVIAALRMEGDGLVIDIAGAETPPVSVSLKAAEVGAALVNYCRHCKIPVPKKATKSLALAGDRLALDVRIGPALPLTPAR